MGTRAPSCSPWPPCPPQRPRRGCVPTAFSPSLHQAQAQAPGLCVCPPTPDSSPMPPLPGELCTASTCPSVSVSLSGSHTPRLRPSLLSVPPPCLHSDVSTQLHTGRRGPGTSVESHSTRRFFPGSCRSPPAKGFCPRGAFMYTP